jgi:broad specificity phosphatase PhoE
LEQSHKLTEALATTQLTAIYSSDLQRARVMADTIAEYHHLEVQSEARWREINMGEWDGRTIASLHDEAPNLVGQLLHDPASFVYPGGESFADHHAIELALENLLATHESGEVALITHGGVCRTLLVVPGITKNCALRDYGCLNVIDWYGHYYLLRLLNGEPALP